MKDCQKLLNQEVNKSCNGFEKQPSAAGLKQFEMLMDNGADPAAMTIAFRNEGATSALIIASARGWDRAIDIFLRRADLDVNGVDADGEHALLAALKKANTSSAKLLLGRSNLRRAHGSGPSCLHIAIRRGLVEVADLIVEQMSDAEREEELEEMRAQRLAGSISALREELAVKIMGKLLSKIEENVLASAARGSENGPAEGPSRLARL